MRVVGADLHDNKRGSPRKDEANHLTHLVTHLLTHWLTQKATIHNILSILNAKINRLWILRRDYRGRYTILDPSSSSSNVSKVSRFTGDPLSHDRSLVVSSINSNSLGGIRNAREIGRRWLSLESL